MAAASSTSSPAAALTPGMAQIVSDSTSQLRTRLTDRRRISAHEVSFRPAAGAIRRAPAPGRSERGALACSGLVPFVAGSSERCGGASETASRSTALEHLTRGGGFAVGDMAATAPGGAAVRRRRHTS